MKVGDTVLMTACGWEHQPVRIVAVFDDPSPLKYFVQLQGNYDYHYTCYESELAQCQDNSHDR